MTVNNENRTFDELVLSIFPLLAKGQLSSQSVARRNSIIHNHTVRKVYR